MKNPLAEGLRDWADGTKRLQDENARLQVVIADANVDALRLHREKMEYFELSIRLRAQLSRSAENYVTLFDKTARLRAALEEIVATEGDDELDSLDDVIAIARKALDSGGTG